MDELVKQSFFVKAKDHVKKVCENIHDAKVESERLIAKFRKELIQARGDDRDTLEVLLYLQLDKGKNLDQQLASPYFMRCDVKFDDEDEPRTLYLGKFPFITEFIYSWVAPVASIRFEPLGDFSYATPEAGKRTGQLLRKDQFMIVNGKIIFMSTESGNAPRELIYQEYFSQQKTAFVLAEIVEQMEKAQDTIIRSHYFGSFLISGPAGSGKTTLALHRLAYLIQSPDTSELFPARKIIVFVQDALTKSYFSDLLPQLGIRNVNITTFDEWAKRLLELPDIRYVSRYDSSELEKDMYEFQKNRAIKAFTKAKLEKDPFATLEALYKPFFSEKEMKLLSSQKKTQYMDRFDLTILLKASLAQKGMLSETVEKWIKKRNGKYVKKMQIQPIAYAGIILDEAENYLAEQIQIFKQCIDPETQAIMYVGDLVQQTLPFTIRDWNEVGEVFDENRKITLQKVYRNTRQILEYIRSKGYKVDIPENIKTGKQVGEMEFDRKADEVQKLSSIVSEKNNQTVGILAKSETDLQEYKKHFSEKTNIHILTINEAQGVEFDIVILVGMKNLRSDSAALPESIRQEREKVDKDLLYVALTRAMSELYVVH